MRANHHGTIGLTTTAVAEFTVAVGLLGGLGVLLVAASYPVVFAVVAAGFLLMTVLQRAAKLVAATGRVCVPGMDVCRRLTA
jgi:hypothetical protein